MPNFWLAEMNSTDASDRLVIPEIIKRFGHSSYATIPRLSTSKVDSRERSGYNFYSGAIDRKYCTA